MSCHNYCSGNTPWGLSGVPVTFRRLLRRPLHSSVSVGDGLCLPSSCQDRTWILSNGQETCSEPPAASQPTASPAAVKLPATLLLVAMCQDPAKEQSFLPASSYLSGSCLSVSYRPLAYVSSSSRPLSLLPCGCSPLGFFACGLQPISIVSSGLQTSTPCLQWMPNSALCVVQSLPSILLYLRRPVTSLFRAMITLKIRDDNCNSALFCSFASSGCLINESCSCAFPVPDPVSCSFPIYICFSSLLSIKL